MTRIVAKWFIVGLWLLTPLLAHAEDFLNVTYHTWYDGDTCKVSIPGLPEVFGDHISIRLKGIDTPEMKGKCAQEKLMANKPEI